MSVIDSATNAAKAGSPLKVSLLLNGQMRELQVHGPTQSLLRALQQNGYTGSKEGCGDGDCGACTVACLGLDPNGKTQTVAINSCLVPAMSMQGANIRTVEGVANGDHLHPIQQALLRCAGSQCGYCTPGFVMSMYADYQQGALCDASVEGNLCRCTGYTSIRRAIRQLAEQTPAPDADYTPAITPTLAQAERLGDWYFPNNVLAACQLKAALADATWIAGATDLGVEFSHGRGAYAKLISTSHIVDLDVVQRTDTAFLIGANVSIARLLELDASWPELQPMLSSMLHWFAAKQVRNRATVGGNIGTASPIGDLLPVLLALDASVELARYSHETKQLQTRLVGMADYFLGYRQTAKHSDELITKVVLPKASAGQRIGQSYKVGKRGSDDISIVAASFVIHLDAQQIIQYARLAYGGVAAIPLRAIQAETALVGQRWQAGIDALVRTQLQAAFQPLSDFRGSAEYRQRLIVNLFSKFVSEHTKS